MILIADFPDNLVTERLVQLKNIPCVVTVGKDFEIIFQEPLACVKGIVYGWNIQALDDRSPALVGGKHPHFCHALITLERVTKCEFKVVDLAFFTAVSGWCPIMENGKLTPPGSFWSKEIDDIGR